MLLAFLASLGTTIAQITDGNIVGTIMDPTGAAIGDVALTLQNVATGVQYTAKTAADGSYRFNNVPVGTYIAGSCSDRLQETHAKKRCRGVEPHYNRQSQSRGR